MDIKFFYIYSTASFQFHSQRPFLIYSFFVMPNKYLTIKAEAESNEMSGRMHIVEYLHICTCTYNTSRRAIDVAH